MPTLKRIYAISSWKPWATTNIANSTSNSPKELKFELDVIEETTPRNEKRRKKRSDSGTSSGRSSSSNIEMIGVGTNGRKTLRCRATSSVEGKQPRFLSHAITDYSSCFYNYSTADILIIDPVEQTREALRVLASKIIIKSKSESRVTAARSKTGKLLIDEGRNATVNCCSTASEALRRLISNGETYAVVLIYEPGFETGTIKNMSLLRTLRENMYENAIAVIVDECTMSTTSRARDHGADCCLIRSHFTTFCTELALLIASLSIRDLYSISRSYDDISIETPLFPKTVSQVS